MIAEDDNRVVLERDRNYELTRPRNSQIICVESVSQNLSKNTQALILKPVLLLCQRRWAPSKAREIVFEIEP
jgi:hypothetical protein